MTFKDLFEKIYNEIETALDNSNKNKDYFLNTYVIPSEVETEKNKNEDRAFPRNIKKTLNSILKGFDNKVGYYNDGDIYYFTNDLEYIKKQNENPSLKVQFIHQKPPIEERNLDLFYYDLRDSEIDRGYTIEQNVLANNIGSLVANQDILKGKPYITDEQFEEMNYLEVNYLENGIEEDMEM